MKATIFGASGSVGQLLIIEFLNRGHDVVAVTRNRSRVTTEHERLTVMEADLGDLSSLQRALEGSEVAVISLGDDVVDTGTDAIVTAMRSRGVGRVEVLTGFGTSAMSRRELRPAMRALVAMVRLVTYPGFVAKERQDAVIRDSGLTFTIVQPPSLTSTAKTATYRHGDYSGKSILGRLARADLVEFMVDNLELDRYVNESVYIQARTPLAARWP
ncbi:MAG: 3-beta hydroxysteroid dehydrogenase/isomerase [Marmoricola sp.]|nr:3-beta hydroxysteroid dehydrogenase/isomerase [Marmoricola sp.]